jgi:oxalate decarboxylase/phosphoglucose isomerase-like protein (cupin superfamily)
MRVGSEEIESRVTSEELGGELAAAEVRMPAGGGPPMLHRHAASELYRVEQGEFAFYLEDDGGKVWRTVATAGEVVAIAAGREHTIRNESAAAAIAFVVYAPGAAMEAFAHAAARLAVDGPPASQRVMAVAAEHGIEITRAVGASR